MGSKEFIQFAKEQIVDYFNSRADKTDKNGHIETGDVYVVSYCKTLQNHKGLFSTPRPDGMYYEITYSGDAGEYYFDAYKKFDNKVITV
jgi:hypothetical protein